MATALTLPLVAEIMRKRLNLPDSSDSDRIIYQIPEALKRTARKGAANPDLRNMFFTDKGTVTGTIATGKVDLSALEDSARILREFLEVGKIYHTSSTNPIELMSPEAAIGSAAYLGTNTNFIAAYIEGKYLILPGGETGTLQFAVPQFPKLISQLPNSDEVHVLFFDTLAEVLQNVPADFVGPNGTPQAGA